MKLKDRELAELNERVTKLQAIATASKADEQKVRVLIAVCFAMLRHDWVFLTSKSLIFVVD